MAGLISSECIVYTHSSGVVKVSTGVLQLEKLSVAARKPQPKLNAEDNYQYALAA